MFRVQSFLKFKDILEKDPLLKQSVPPPQLKYPPENFLLSACRPRMSSFHVSIELIIKHLIYASSIVVTESLSVVSKELRDRTQKATSEVISSS